MALLDTGSARLDYLVRGAGEPVTVFAHGVGATITETRPMASGVLGTRVFFAFRGHGRSTPPPTGCDYAELAGDLLAVADHFAASRAVGVSLGAAALLRLLTDRPDRFQRVVLFSPAVLDRPRHDPAIRQLVSMADAVDRGDVASVRRLLDADVPAGVRRALPDLSEYNRRRARELAGMRIGPLLRGLPDAVPVPEPGRLTSVTAQALVLAQHGDPVHPSTVAEAVAAALPTARLHVFSEAGAVFLTRRRLRELVAGFLNAPAG